MKYENLSKLVDIVKDKLNEYNHFVAEISYGFDFRKEFNLKIQTLFRLREE